MTAEPESIADALVAAMAESEAETEEAPEVSQEEAPTETEVEAVAETEVEEDNDESEEPATVFQAPEHWSSDERTQFDSLPPEAQEVLLARDKSFQTGYQEKAQSISAITDAIEPFKESLIRRGMTPEQAIGILFNAQDQLDKNPMEGILRIAQSYGIGDQLKNQFAPQTDDDDFTDPGIKALQQELKDLKGQIAQTNEGMQQQVIDAGNQQINTFKDAVDGDGKALHPYFEQLMPEITNAIQADPTVTLENAYQKLVWTVPAFRDSQQKTVVEKTDEEKAQKVKKAKKAAKGVQTNGKADPNESDEPLSLHDELAQAFAQQS